MNPLGGFVEHEKIAEALGPGFTLPPLDSDNKCDTCACVGGR